MENNNNELLTEGRILALKIFAEAYLIGKGTENIKEIFPDKKIDKDTVLKGREVYVLHNWLMEEYKDMGLDLAECVKKNGEELSEDKLSNYEIEELAKRADKLIVQLSVFKSYVTANRNN